MEFCGRKYCSISDTTELNGQLFDGNKRKLKVVFDYAHSALKYGNSELHDVLFKFVEKKFIGEVIIKL